VTSFEEPFALVIFTLIGGLYKAIQIDKGGTPITSQYTLGLTLKMETGEKTIVLPYNDENQNPHIMFLNFADSPQTVYGNIKLGDNDGDPKGATDYKT